MFRFVPAAVFAAALAATPALAAERANNPQQISDAVKAGCKVHAVRSQAGKIDHQPTYIYCNKARALETASRDAPRERQKSGVD